MSETNGKEKIIEIKNLKKYFPMKKKQVLKAVDNVTMDIYRGEVLSLVGESGSGKTTLGRTVSRLYPKTAGDILVDGKPAESYSIKEFTKKIQMIFQDPQASLNPRIGIERALGVDPEILVCDEPISALDVSIQAQVVNLLKDLQKQRNLTLLFIAHDLSMVKYISDRVAVMYRGKVVELGKPEDVYNNPVHSYTKSLISAVPVVDPDFTRHEKVEMEETYLRSPVGDVSEINFIPEESELTEYKPGHFVETSFLLEHKLI